MAGIRIELHMNDSHQLSVVIPAYNEAARLPQVLIHLRSYCDTEFGASYEVIVVDDGSKDGTLPALHLLQDQWPQLIVIVHPENQGKGAAVRTGVLAAIGSHVLFSDADGATPIEDEKRLRSTIDLGADIAVGSRVAPDAHVVRHRRWDRRVIAWFFRRMVRQLVDVPVLDSQCGFKMFKRDTAHSLFSKCSETGYLFDLFVLRLASQQGYRIDEVAVSWRNQDGSKIRMFHDSFEMWRGLRSIEMRVADVLHDTKANQDLTVEQDIPS